MGYATEALRSTDAAGGGTSGSFLEKGTAFGSSVTA